MGTETAATCRKYHLHGAINPSQVPLSLRPTRATFDLKKPTTYIPDQTDNANLPPTKRAHLPHPIPASSMADAAHNDRVAHERLMAEMMANPQRLKVAQEMVSFSSPRHSQAK